MTLIVDTDDVLDLFGIDDRDIYAKGTIEDAIYDGTLKPTEPEHKTGLWIDDDCSECGQYVFRGAVRNYCPNCGAKMNVG